MMETVFKTKIQKTRQAAFLSSLASTIFLTAACAQTSADPALPYSNVSNAEASVQSVEPPEERLAQKGVSENDDKTMTETDNIYWVKKPGTLVYNGLDQIVRSLRFQPQVTIYSKKGEWGRIDPQKDEWVKLSDITPEKPAGMLAGPENDNGLPRVTLERP